MQENNELGIDLDQVTPEQEFIMKRFAKMVGDVLTVAEASIPQGRQFNSVKKILNEKMYNARNDLLRHFSE